MKNKIMVVKIQREKFWWNEIKFPNTESWSPKIAFTWTGISGTNLSLWLIFLDGDVNAKRNKKRTL